MPKIRIGIVGAGGIAGAHLNAYAAHPSRCQIVGIVDVIESAAQARATEFGGQPFTELDAMLDATRPDAISICTPPKFHLPSAKAAAQRGIAVLCEKPPARSLDETRAIVDAMDGALLQFAFCHRFHRPVEQAIELIQNGKMGKLVQIENRFGMRFARAGNSWFTEKDIAGGGMLIDTLVHSVDIFRALTGGDAIVDVSAAISSSLPIEVEDSASMLVQSESGVIGTLNCSWVTPVSEAVVRIYGTEGQAMIDYASDAGLRYKLADDPDWTTLPFDAPDRFTRQADHFMRCLETGERPMVCGDDGIAVMGVIERAYQSASLASRSER